MARPRSADYDDKRQAILSHSAAVFAKHGYDRASMAEVAQACGVSKALLYHYYVNKAELLFDILHAHLQVLVDAVHAVDKTLPPRERLRGLVGALLEAYRDADNEHKIQLNELSKLPPKRQKVLTDMERDLVRVFADTIAAVNPALAGDALLKPVTMSLFGMINWHYMWFRDGRALTRGDYADLVTTLLVEGAAALTAPAPMKAKRTARA
ncbi:TetR/AcrR family transcriptional regulator [Pseudolabrys taiwanensis]|uniref:TetR/AcrR family transcriptional regulator n=1 Tax=Pseudolabrys taiwanensis TaxID=331696 RepID=A0A346A3C4_9HYPH|nr:TetR/AcrR family transcriptional regulator [Pseudolabrys taiwanensis]AXK83671.1 TetR/AcrR family transcriptional regulator [Pseudolabrys taiwanensis]